MYQYGINGNYSYHHRSNRHRSVQDSGPIRREPSRPLPTPDKVTVLGGGIDLEVVGESQAVPHDGTVVRTEVQMPWMIRHRTLLG